LEDQLIDGHCYLNVPFEARPVFNKHKANSITRDENPGVFDALERLFADPNEDLFDAVSLDSRGVSLPYIEVKIGQDGRDRNIRNLRADSDFQQLDEGSEAQVHAEGERKFYERADWDGREENAPSDSLDSTLPPSDSEGGRTSPDSLSPETPPLPNPSSPETPPLSPDSSFPNSLL
jgi:hypothetical protein